MSFWSDVEQAPADAILGITEAFQKDGNPQKITLGVGVFKDDHNVTPILKSVHAAEKILLKNETTKNYLPISGAPAYATEVQKLIFGHTDERAQTAHTPGGTGALRLGADLLKAFRKEATIHICNPTWANHKSIFGAAEFTCKDYPYYNPATKSLDFDAMIDTLSKIPAGDVVLLHVCCHNPTGVDLTNDQWEKVTAVAKKAGWLPFLDFAYQGFRNSPKEDRFACELMLDSGIDFFVASSFSKNFGLYNERTGALTVVAETADEAVVAMSHVKKTARVLYSNPPAHGGNIAVTILTNDELRAQWLDELEAMRKRIKEFRDKLVRGLTARGVPMDFEFINHQHGMFSFSGLSDAQVEWLKKEKSIYVVGGGRINICGLTTSNLDYICDAIAESFKI
jgi:aspartate aminotransferase/aromatic-amino-acid transaminase